MRSRLTKYLAVVCTISLGILAYPGRLQAQETWTPSDFVIEGQTVYGLSESGLTKLQSEAGALILPATDAQGQPVTRVGSFAFRSEKHREIAEYVGRPGVDGIIDDLDLDGEKIRAVGADIPSTLLRSVVIPEGYTAIGQDAFGFYRSLANIQLPQSLRTVQDYAFAHNAIETLTLPEGLEHLADAVFFDNRLGEITLPKSLKSLGERVFKANDLTRVEFAAGSQLTQLQEAVFEDNRLTQLNLPETITQIASNAFNGNPGEVSYGGFVVLKTPQGNNPQKLLHQGNYYVDPDDSLKTTVLDLDTQSWTEADFRFEGDTILGFSESGRYKVRFNKQLVIPEKHQDTVIRKIAPEAFRNIDPKGEALVKYDLESVDLPHTIEEIGDFAFQLNKLTELVLDTDDPLKRIGAGAFMGNRLTTLSLPSGVTRIEDAAFHLNNLEFILIPRETIHLGRSAFRQNQAQFVGFEEGAKLTEIGELAFAESGIQNVLFENAKELQTIGIQAFANNQLADLAFPEGLKTLESEAFARNQLTEVPIPAGLQKVAFNAFDANPGVPAEDHKVVLKLPDETQSTPLADGDNFVIKPDIEVTEHPALSARVAELKALNLEKLRPQTAEQMKAFAEEGQALLEKQPLKLTAVQSYLERSGFFMDRLPLDEAIHRAQPLLKKAEGAQQGSNSDAKILEEKVKRGEAVFNNAAVESETVDELVKTIQLLSDRLEGKGAIAKAKSVQGVYELQPEQLPIPPYYIGLQVYFDENQQILLVVDRSHTIGEGSVNEYGLPIENIDEDNAGYHDLAIQVLPDYVGQTAQAILAAQTPDDLAIRSIPKAPEHRLGIHRALQDAARELLKATDPAEKPQDGVPHLPPAPFPGTTVGPVNGSDLGRDQAADSSLADALARLKPQRASTASSNRTEATQSDAIPSTGEHRMTQVWSPESLLALALTLLCIRYYECRTRRQKASR